ncbi:DinB family protein [Falsiroseomonas tokyonensis]|uniref:DinB family protein n=1 Tax=Falsiroseomonas tokyonensis TaxID=430521 RepID=A0ABV7BVW3_9PROT|nr:DinB family protein [Falsiroseomonas tokyonensis]MBU8538765.1 DinB family protein [Falsiroseomonas tokyonensis]
MVTVEWVRLMAAYNAEMNRRLYGAASGLTDAQRREDRGAFFGSVHGTLSHLMWGDTTWMSRFAGWAKPEGGIKDSPTLFPDWDAMRAARQELDARIEAWAAALEPAWLEGSLGWFSGAMGRDIRRPRWVLVTHFFNHQAHHRGQAHALITGFGAHTGDTDLPFILPESSFD